METRINTYEAMFLVDAGLPSFEVASEPIQKILQRFGAEVLSLKQWDDRKLAYEIKGRKRGLYILCYFKMDAEKLVEMEHECKLNETILRVLVIRKDKLTEDEINAPTPAEQAGTSATSASSDISSETEETSEDDVDETEDDVDEVAVDIIDDDELS